MMVQGASRVETPAGLAGFGRRVRPAMTDNLVDPLEKIAIGFGFQVQRCCPEGRRMNPGPGFCRSDGLAVQVAGGGGPARWAESSPVRIFALRKIHQPVAGKGHRGLAISLATKLRAVSPCPLPERHQVVAVGKVRERTAPVAADGRGLGAGIAHQCQEMGPQVVAAPPAEFFHQVRSPVGPVDFQAVAEDCVRPF